MQQSIFQRWPTHKKQPFTSNNPKAYDQHNIHQCDIRCNLWTTVPFCHLKRLASSFKIISVLV